MMYGKDRNKRGGGFESAPLLFDAAYNAGFTDWANDVHGASIKSPIMKCRIRERRYSLLDSRGKDMASEINVQGDPVVRISLRLHHLSIPF